MRERGKVFVVKRSLKPSDLQKKKKIITNLYFLSFTLPSSVFCRKRAEHRAATRERIKKKKKSQNVLDDVKLFSFVNKKTNIKINIEQTNHMRKLYPWIFVLRQGNVVSRVFCIRMKIIGKKESKKMSFWERKYTTMWAVRNESGMYNSAIEAFFSRVLLNFSHLSLTKVTCLCEWHILIYKEAKEEIFLFENHMESHMETPVSRKNPLHVSGIALTQWIFESSLSISFISSQRRKKLKENEFTCRVNKQQRHESY